MQDQESPVGMLGGVWGWVERLGGRLPVVLSLFCWEIRLVIEHKFE
jgi:hypothetical protein